MKKRIYLLTACCVLFLVSCREEAGGDLADVARTAVPTPAATNTATATATPTNTATPTETATAPPTETNTPTPEPSEPPTETPTNTSVPPTATNTAVPLPTEPPATTTTAPPAPVSAPPPAPAPAGNMLSNPGFEFGADLWERPGSGTSLSFHTADSQPQFVHSGQRSLLLITFSNARVWQQVSTGIITGTTYRAGGWLKIWSSNQEDRLVSVNPADYVGRICINTNGDDDPNLPTTICSNWVRPLDVWQFISVDATATNDRITVILQVGISNSQSGMHNEAMWDDITLGTAPSAATATPAPAAEPVRPNPIAFSPTALRDSMNSVRSIIEQAGGLLDRLVNGENQTCTEYQGYYDDAIRSATYSGVADDWAGIYNDYIFAVENFLASNESINSLCDGGGGGLVNSTTAWHGKASTTV